MFIVLLYLVIEIVAVVAIGSWIGALPTLLLLLAGGVIGLWLTRREGARAFAALSGAITERRVAHRELTDGLLIAIGGLLILLPGFVSDVIGLAFLLPPTRKLIRARMVRAAELRAPTLRTARIRGEGPVIDGEVVDDDRPTGRPAHELPG
jgi:UPF0716 protein FxsA